MDFHGAAAAAAAASASASAAAAAAAAAAVPMAEADEAASIRQAAVAMLALLSSYHGALGAGQGAPLPSPLKRD